MHHEHRPPIGKSRATNLIEDPKIEATINELLEDVLVAEEKTFMPGIEAFETRANRIRYEVRDAFIRMQERLQKGYDAITNWLEEQGIARPTIQQEAVLVVDDRQQFLELLGKKKSLFEILGFSEEDMTKFCRAAYQMTCDNDYQKGRDAFFFLVTLAPEVFYCWFGLAICTTHLKDYELALAATLRAINLDPTNIDSYLNAVHIYMQLHDLANAEALCKKGIDYARAAEDEPWAKEFSAALKNAQDSINFNKPKGG